MNRYPEIAGIDHQNDGNFPMIELIANCLQPASIHQTTKYWQYSSISKIRDYIRESNRIYNGLNCVIRALVESLKILEKFEIWKRKANFYKRLDG